MTQQPTPTENFRATAAKPRRRPRYILGTFWLILSLAGFAYIFSSNPGHLNGLWLGPALLAYSIYLYRGGRFGFFFF